MRYPRAVSVLVLMAVAHAPAAEGATPAERARDAYNRACVEALAGRKDAAVASLARAADMGFPFTATMLRDTDLDSIRDHPGYPAVVERIRANNARALEAFKVAAADAKVL